jgi:nucleoside-diphosphate-sugar epimerase
LAEADLGWKPKVALEDGLDPTIEYFRKLLAAG